MTYRNMGILLLLVLFFVNTAGAITVTINQASWQADPTKNSPINFEVVFNESVSDFNDGDVTLDGSASPTTASVTGGGTTYNPSLSKFRVKKFHNHYAWTHQPQKIAKNL